MDEKIRQKPGRKKGTDNKIPITVYIEQSVVALLGDGSLDKGKEVARTLSSSSIYNKVPREKTQIHV